MAESHVTQERIDALRAAIGMHTRHHRAVREDVARLTRERDAALALAVSQMQAAERSNNGNGRAGNPGPPPV